MRVYVASDHAGFELKTALVSRLSDLGYDTVDCGAEQYDPDDDYTPYCVAAGEKVAGDHGSLGVVIGGSGNGEQIAANKVHGIRAALAWNPETARLAREHNDANVVAIGARQHTVEEACELVELFLSTAFSGEERHARRIRKVADYEATRSVDPAEAALDGGADVD